MPNDTINNDHNASAALALSDKHRLRPVYVPMPSGLETERYSGLKRGKLNILILPCEANNFRPPVKSISLKPPGALKGKRLIVLASLLEYLAKLEADQTADATRCELTN